MLRPRPTQRKSWLQAAFRRASPSARGGRGDGRRGGGRRGLEARYAARQAHPGSIARRNRAAGTCLRVGVPLKWPLADGAFRPSRIPIRTPAVAATDRGRRARDARYCTHSGRATGLAQQLTPTFRRAVNLLETNCHVFDVPPIACL
jgi:hypothetical protein